MPCDPQEAPGLKSRRNGDGTLRHYWCANRPAMKAGYTPTVVRLHGDMDEVADRCRMLQAQMQQWLSGLGGKKEFDGTLGALLDKYESDSHSPFQDLKEKTRRDYQKDVKRLRAAAGGKQLATFTRSDLKSIYDAARKPKVEGGPERIRSARGLMVMLRIVMGYGISERVAHCSDLREILKEMRFKSPKPRRSRPTYAQAKAVYDTARAAGCRSIALGTALQFEAMLRQYDVTGIWETIQEREYAAIVMNGRRWAGMTWGDIGDDGVLRWETPKRERYIEIDLSLYPLIAEAIGLIPQEKRVGPLVVDERTGLPYSEGGYCKRWREFADAAGLPKDIWNRDFRAGGVTEGRQSGADIGDVSKHAAHSDPSFTARVYDRGTLDAARRVAEARTRYRNSRNAS